MENDNVDDMLADIMGEEKARVEAGSGVGIGSQEGAALSEAIDVMEDSAASHGAEISQNELENLFASNESQEPAGRDDVVGAQDSLALDSKTKILVESVGFSKIEICEPEGESPEDSDLFVIAEKIVTSDLGEHSFSQKLVSCVKKIARIHDFKRIIMLYGLPSDNEEFKQFYFHFINKRNVILATSADLNADLLANLTGNGFSISEAHLIGIDNKIKYSSNPVLVNYDMSSQAQSKEFECLLNDKEFYVQNIMEAGSSATAAARMKYAGIKLATNSSNLSYLQVGMSEDEYHAVLDKKVERSANYRHIGNKGFIIVAKPNGTVISTVNGANVDSKIGLSTLKLDEMGKYEGQAGEFKYNFYT